MPSLTLMERLPTWSQVFPQALQERPRGGPCPVQRESCILRVRWRKTSRIPVPERAPKAAEDQTRGWFGDAFEDASEAKWGKQARRIDVETDTEHHKALSRFVEEIVPEICSL